MLQRARTATAGLSNVAELQFVVVSWLLFLNYASATDCDVFDRRGLSLKLASVTVVEEFLVWLCCVERANYHGIGSRLRP